MRHFIHAIRRRRPTPGPARRLRTARPGSVLILVVALLVLMALIGTAWLTTARTDRYASQQNSSNVKLDMLVQSAVNLAQSAIVDDTYAAGRFRPRPGGRPLDYEHYDSPLRDLWLASRTPLESGGTPYWEFISGAPTRSGFESPYSLDASDAPIGSWPNRYEARAGALVNAIPTFIDVPNSAGGTTRYPALQIPVVPGFPPLNNAKFLAADTDKDGIADAALFRLPVSDGSGITYYGAIKIIDNNSAINPTVAWAQNTADATLTPPRPAGQFFPTSVNLYNLLREIDPGDRDNQIAGLNRFRLTATPADDTGGAGGTPPSAAQEPVVNDTGNGWPTLADGTTRQSKFLFASEALWRNLGSRPANPGYNGAFDPVFQYKNLPIGESMAMAYKFTLKNPFASQSILESADRLAISVYQTPPVQTAPYLPGEEMVTTPPVRPGWYPGNFDPMSLGGMPLRALLVSRNAVSNASPSQFVDAGEWSGTANYQFGQRVRWNPGGDSVQRSYVCIRGNGPYFGGTNAPPGDIVSEGIWEPMPWHEEPTRANINSATFGQLWAAYWSVMNAGSPTGPTTPATPTDPRDYPDSILVGGAAPYPSPAPANPPTQRGRFATPLSRKQFRNPLRDPGHLTVNTVAPATTVYQMTPYEVMRLRAALAAVNAIDIRDADDDVTSRRIVLRAFAYGAPDPADRTEGEVDVTVFGNEAQPYITEIYADTFNIPPPPEDVMPPPSANPQGYVAVELHNPTDQDIKLTNWNLGIIDRRRVVPTPKPYPDMSIRAITDFTGFGNPGPSIPARGYLVLENYDPSGAVGHRPRSTRAALTGTAANFHTVKNLHEVLRKVPANPLIPGGELVLLRPRRADGVLVDSPDANDPYFEVNSTTYEAPTLDADGNPVAELTAQAQSLSTMIPVDSFDFTEFTQVGTEADAPFQQWHYARASGTSNYWRCVYPGRWDAAHRWHATDPYRQEGIKTETWTLAETADWEDAMNPATPTTISLAAGSDASYTNPFTKAIQLNHYWFGGFNKPYEPFVHPTPQPAAPTPWVFPFGGFARNGDMLQVPFIGAYSVRRDGAGAGYFLEMNAITMDSIFAHDGDTDYAGDATPGDSNPDTAPPNDADEHVGRFAPLTTSTTYDWAADLFHHLTVESPQDDHLPAVDPWNYPGDPPQGVNGVTAAQPPSITYGRVRASPTSQSIQGTLNLATEDVNGTARDDFYKDSRIRFLTGVARGHQRLIAAYDAADQELSWEVALPAAAVPANGDLFQILGPSEDSVGIEGLVNVNTAPLEVLAAVPMVDDVNDNRVLAEQIVNYRNTTGPITSLFDLNLLTGAPRNFKDALGPAATTDFVDTQGDYTPYDNATPPPPNTTDGVVGDFESQYLMMTRVSNLLTTRSDTFTVYVEVQGWRDVGLNAPEMVLQRRQAFIADRNALTQENRVLTTVNVPNE